MGALPPALQGAAMLRPARAARTPLGGVQEPIERPFALNTGDSMRGMGANLMQPLSARVVPLTLTSPSLAAGPGPAPCG